MGTEVLSWRTIQNNKLNHVNPNMNCSLAHEEKKFRICFFLKAMHIPYYTEAIFKNGEGRADIFLPDRNLAIEVLETEEEERFEKKKLTYPCRVIGINSLEFVTYDSLEKKVN